MKKRGKRIIIIICRFVMSVIVIHICPCHKSRVRSRQLAKIVKRYIRCRMLRVCVNVTKCNNRILSSCITFGIAGACQFARATAPSSERGEFRRSDCRATGRPLAPLKFRTQDTVVGHRRRPAPSLCRVPPVPRTLLSKNRSQHKHTNQCLISFTKGYAYTFKRTLKNRIC